MRAARVVRHSEPTDAVVVEDVEVPEPGPGQVRVAVAAASLNFGDIARCRGGVAAVMAQPPFTLGMDVCGIVDAAGDGRRGVGRPARRRHHARSRWAGWPSRRWPARGSTRRPSSTTSRPRRSRCPSTSRTSRCTSGPASSRARPSLVRGGASAVGTAAIQLAVAAGARVIAVAGGPEKAALCAELGAARAVDHTTEDVFDVVMDETGDRGADVIFDPIGGDQTEMLWTCGALGGRYLAVGFNDDPESGLTGRRCASCRWPT